MKKLFISIFLVTVIFLTFPGCSKNIDYLEYISEKRSNIYLYSDDEVDIKIYCSQKEQPYCADGIKGEMCDVCEVFVKLNKNPSELSISLCGHEGEMNYQAVDNLFYLSFSEKAFETDSLDITLDIDGESKTYKALTATYDGVLSCDDAVNCVIEHDGELVSSLTSNGLFNGEIYVRLIYDEGCYYYVGIITKDKTVFAYLVDGERGKIISTKK